MNAGTPNAAFWQGKRVLVTGGAGFIGQAVVRALLGQGVGIDDLVVPRSATHDLRDPGRCREAVAGCDVVIHLAAPTGSIAYSRSHPASQFHDCMLINLNLLAAARVAGVERVIALGNLLAYPAEVAVPFREEEVHAGSVPAQYLGIGQSKRDLINLAEMYRAEYGFHVVNVLAANAYGPHDHFDGPQAHVIPATIVKCFRDEDLVVWGDGSATRDFLYVDDLARGLLQAGTCLEPAGLVNIASGHEVSVRDLVTTIATLTGFRRRVVFDASQPGGDRRRVASTARADALIGFSPGVPLSEGLRRTIDWFTHSRAVAV
jgi:GDP-L-fucose synthase